MNVFNVPAAGVCKLSIQYRTPLLLCSCHCHTGLSCYGNGDRGRTFHSRGILHDTTADNVHTATTWSQEALYAGKESLPRCLLKCLLRFDFFVSLHLLLFLFFPVLLVLSGPALLFVFVLFLSSPFLFLPFLSRLSPRESKLRLRVARGQPGNRHLICAALLYFLYLEVLLPRPILYLVFPAPVVELLFPMSRRFLPAKMTHFAWLMSKSLTVVTVRFPFGLSRYFARLSHYSFD